MTLKLKLTLLLLITALIPTIAAAQGGVLKAKVLDADASSMPIAGAVIELIPMDRPDEKGYYATDGSGLFTSALIPYGNYTINISFLGYESVSRNVSVEKAETTLHDIMLLPSTVEMEAIVKEVKALRASQNGDTLNYNASAFKVANDADVEGLLSKMPGISIDDGEVTAQGEEIKKIYVDGREFFGNDIATALKSLPAEVVDRIEVYDKLSDEAEYSGIDDGQGAKTINIVTHKSMRQGVFGKIFGGGGYEPKPNTDDAAGKYLAGGSVNLFNNTSRVTVIGLANNINQQNFSFEDIMGVSDDSNSSASSFMIRPLPGVATVNAVGVNYSDVFGKDDKLKVQGSYFFNHTKTSNIQSRKRWYEGDATSKIDSLFQQSNTLTDNINHRINGRIDWDINKKNSVLIRPTLSLQTNAPFYDTSGTRFGDSYSAGYQEFSNMKENLWNGINIGTSANYRHSFASRRNFTLGGGFTINNYDGDGKSTTYPNEPNNSDEYIVKYKYDGGPSFRRNLYGNIGYTEPLANFWTLNLSYRISQNYQSTDKRSYNTDDTFVPLPENEILSASNISSSTYLTHKVGGGVRFGKKKSNLVANVYYQLSDLYTESSEEGVTVTNDPTFKNLIYSLVGQAYFNAENSLRVYASSSTSNPSLTRLQNSYNIGSSSISKGNAELDPTYNNNLRFRYINSNLEKGRTFMWMLWGQKTDNYIASHVVLRPEDVILDGVDPSDSEDLDQYSTWVNLDNKWSFGSHFDYGLPLDFMKCNLNFKCGLSYTLTPSIFGGTIESDGSITGGDETKTDKMSYYFGTVLGSNISENLDFTIQWHGTYNEATNESLASYEEATKNRYFNQSASASLKWVFGSGFTFTTSVTYRQYLGITNDYNDQYTLCNAFIGRKIFKSKRGELNIGINDAFDQNTSISRSIGTNYTQNTSDVTLGRYFSAQFIYNLRYFGRNASTNAKDYKGMAKYIK